MIFRIATQLDLPYLKQMYKDIVANMRQQNINIWDDVYPCEFLEADIKKEALYVLSNDTGDILAAFALCETNVGEKYIIWEEAKEKEAEKACYIDRLGVNVSYSRQGIASQMLDFAMIRARELGYTSLRLFVVDSNSPAIHLYQKNGFEKKDGLFHEKIDDETTLCEYGFERKIHFF